MTISIEHGSHHSISVIANIEAATYFGARHAIETLSQLMAFDQVSGDFIMIESAQIADSPEFRHRGVLVDTARNFMPLDVIRRVIDGMAFNKVVLITNITKLATQTNLYSVCIFHS